MCIGMAPTIAMMSSLFRRPASCPLPLAPRSLPLLQSARATHHTSPTQPPVVVLVLVPELVLVLELVQRACPTTV